MERYNLKNDVKVFGVEVENFPQGIGEAFDELIVKISGKIDRSFYGMSEMTDKGFRYKAVVEEKYEGEGEKYDCKQYEIEKGEYLTATLNEWRKKTDCIKDIFFELMRDECADKTKPCIEWYKNDDEMLCMVKSKT